MEYATTIIPQLTQKCLSSPNYPIWIPIKSQAGELAYAISKITGSFLFLHIYKCFVKCIFILILFLPVFL